MPEEPTIIVEWRHWTYYWGEEVWHSEVLAHPNSSYWATVHPGFTVRLYYKWLGPVKRITSPTLEEACFEGEQWITKRLLFELHGRRF